jgi:LysM repeat protein
MPPPFAAKSGLIGLAALIVLAACGPAAAKTDSTSTPALIPYIGTRVTPTPSLTATAALTEPPLATPTPLSHTIVEGETLLGLAERYGISLDALLAANPGLNASFLSIGQEVLIPQADGVGPNEIPSPTPAPVTESETTCYATAAGELWCFLLVSNDATQPLENLSGVLRFFSTDGDEIAAVDMVAPLNLLPANKSMPLIAYVADPPEGWNTLRGRLLTAYVSTRTERYIGTEIQSEFVTISEGGLAAQVQGTVALSGSQEASSVWVLAVASDADGVVVGQRRWESDGATLNFDYSLGPEIDSVAVLAEARP